MLTVAVTGGIGSGKSEVCRILERLRGVPVYDSDSRARLLYDRDPSLLEAIEQALCLRLRQPSGGWDRAALAKALFADPEARSRVEAIVHPRVMEDFLAWKAALPGETPLVVFESALLPAHPELVRYFDRVVLVEASERTRLRRASARDGKGEKEIAARMAAQAAPALKADAVLPNDEDDLAALEARTLALFDKLLEQKPKNMDERLITIHEAAACVASRLEGRKPEVGIVLGSGLGKLADLIENPLVIPYKDIPGFPVSTAIGHKGNYIIGSLGGKTVIAMQGRIHYYEGYRMDQVVLPIRVMQKIGIKYLFVSNAAGATTSHNFHPGDLMIIRDHINMLPNPLIGPNHDEFGPRFPDMTRPYDPKLIAAAKGVAARMGISVLEGVYLGLTGPTYETPAEYRFFRTIGADAVGMSTIPEVIVARQSDIPVFGMSVITDVAHDDYSDDYVTDGDAIVAAANAAADKMSALFTQLIETL